MSRIFVLDIMMSYGHKKFNYYYLKILAENHKLFIFNDGEYYNDLVIDNDNITLCDYPIDDALSNSISIRYQMIKMFNYIKNNKLLCCADYMLVVGYDTLIFPLFFLICRPKIPIFVIQHQNLDDTRFYIKKMAFNLYKNKIIHLVLDKEFIKPLRKRWNIESEILYLPHYLSKLGYCDEESNSNIVVALSNSNDENKIDKLIMIDKRGILEKINIKIYVKSKNKRYKSNNLIVFKGYINDDIYAEKFNLAKAVLLLFPDTYDIRFSCTLIEGIINYKLVIGNEIPFVNVYKERYPNNVKCFSTEEELIELLSNVQKIGFDKSERRFLLERLSDQAVREALGGIFHEVKF